MSRPFAVVCLGPMTRPTDLEPFFAAAWNRRCETPDALALVVYRSFLQPEELSWAELFDQVGARAARLAPHVPKGTTLFLMEPDVRETVLWWLAAVAIGAVPGILTPPTSKVSEDRREALLAAMAEGYPDALLLVSAESVDMAWSAVDRVLVADQLTDPGQAPDFAALSTGQLAPVDRPFLFQQSSGTTGLRKGMFMTEASVCGHLASYGQTLELSEEDVWLSWLPLYHDMGLVGVFLNAFYHGRPQILCSPMLWLAHPEWLFHATEFYGATLLWLPNFAFQLLGDRHLNDLLGPDALSSLRMVISCSEPVLFESVDVFSRRVTPLGLSHDRLGASYAMAETVFAVTQTPPGAGLVSEYIDPVMLDEQRLANRDLGGRWVVSSGRALPGVEIRICDHDGRRLADGEVGQIHIKSPHRMTAYCGIGSEHDPFDAEDFYLSGDYGYLRAGELFVLGRQDDLIIRAGRNIDPAVIEASVSGVPGVKGGRVACFGVPNSIEGTMTIVLLVESSDGHQDHADLIAAITQKCQRSFDLTPNETQIVPAGFIVKSSSGKVSRSATRKKYMDG